MRDVQRWLKLCTKSKTFGKAEKAQVTKERVNVDDLPVEEVSKIVQEELQAFAAYHGVDMEHLLQAYERAPFATKSEAAVSEKNRRDDACWQQVPVVVASRLQGSAAPTSQDVFDVQQWIDRHIFKPRGGYRFNTIVDGDDGPYRVPNLHGSEIDDVIISLRPLVACASFDDILQWSAALHSKPEAAAVPPPTSAEYSFWVDVFSRPRRDPLAFLAEKFVAELHQRGVKIALTTFTIEALRRMLNSSVMTAASGGKFRGGFSASVDTVFLAYRKQTGCWKDAHAYVKAVIDPDSILYAAEHAAASPFEIELVYRQMRLEEHFGDTPDAPIPEWEPVVDDEQEEEEEGGGEHGS